MGRSRVRPFAISEVGQYSIVPAPERARKSFLFLSAYLEDFVSKLSPLRFLSAVFLMPSRSAIRRSEARAFYFGGAPTLGTVYRAAAFGGRLAHTVSLALFSLPEKEKSQP